MPKGSRFLLLLPCMNGDSATRHAASSCYQTINDSGGVFARWLHLEFIEVIPLQWQWLKKKSELKIKWAAGTFPFPEHQFDSSFFPLIAQKQQLLWIVSASVLSCSFSHPSDTTSQTLPSSEVNPTGFQGNTFPQHVTWHLVLHLNGSRPSEA